MWRLDVPSLVARRPLATEEEVPVDPPGGEPASAAYGSLLSLWTARGPAQGWQGWSLPQRGKEGREEATEGRREAGPSATDRQGREGPCNGRGSHV